MAADNGKTIGPPRTGTRQMPSSENTTAAPGYGAADLAIVIDQNRGAASSAAPGAREARTCF